MNDVYDAEQGLEVVQPQALEAIVRSEVDMQVATAKRWPRSGKKFRERALSMATTSTEVAEQCFYRLKRRGEGGKPTFFEGPSVRLAEIVAMSYGNLRSGTRIIGEDDRTVTAQGVAWDMESNNFVTRETKRRITNRSGRRYSDDMVITTSNAAAAIAWRNAIFTVVPRAIVWGIMRECQQVVVGDKATFSANRDKWVKWALKLGVAKDELCALLEVQRIEDLDGDGLLTLIGYGTAIRDAEMTRDEFVGYAKEAHRKNKAIDLSDDAPGQIAEAKPAETVAPTARRKRAEPKQEQAKPDASGASQDVMERALACYERFIDSGLAANTWHDHMRKAIGKTKVEDADDAYVLEGYLAEALPSASKPK